LVETAFVRSVPSLLDEVQRGAEVIGAKNGKPVARVIKIEGVGERPMGFVKGRLTRAFFEPLPDEELAPMEVTRAHLGVSASLPRP
jgi:antitoxin (DNA-binding transcriptional repressor) of toxin-antitoxin stability system